MEAGKNEMTIVRQFLLLALNLSQLDVGILVNSTSQTGMLWCQGVNRHFM
jgi:hypothetical protein